MSRILHNQGWSNYLAILLIWGIAWLAPQYLVTFDWYATNFHLFQALNPLLLIYAIFALTADWWRRELGMILILQIFHNLGDAYFDSDWLQYNAKQTYLNFVELLIIAIGGGGTLIYRTTQALRNRADKSGRDRHYPHGRILSGKSGIAGHD